MKPTSLKQKIILIFLSIILTFICLEVTLRAGGFLFLFFQERANQIGLTDPDAYRVLCIGESTTAFGDEFSYPSQLENILNKRSESQKFKVINKGVPAINTNEIVDQMSHNLNKYRPDLVVTMIGINDEYYYFEKQKTFLETKFAFLSNFRVVKLFKLVKAHLKDKLGIKRGIGDERIQRNDLIQELERPDRTLKRVEKITKKIEQEEQVKSRLIEEGKQKEVWFATKRIEKLNDNKRHLLILIGRWFEGQKNFGQAEAAYFRACKFAPKDERAFVELGRCYKAQGRYQDAIGVFKRAIMIDPQMTWGYIELGRTFNLMGEPEKTTVIFEKLALSGDARYWLYVELGDWFVKQGMLDDAEKVYLKAIKKEPKNSLVYGKLSELYKKQGRLKESEEFALKSESRIQESYDKNLLKVYDTVSQKILKSGAKMISMQYPLRDNKWLKENLKDRDKIIFLDNKSNFEEVLSSSQYTEYFYDNFAGDFGHCTIKGNQLIAEQLADVILDSI